MSHMMSGYKPMLACDWEPSKLCFPLWVQPKIDGVRALNLTGRLTGRSLKEHGNRHITELFSGRACEGFDGEMAAELQTHPGLCRLTTSAVSTHEGEPYVLWWLFDYITPDTVMQTYCERYAALGHRLATMEAASAVDQKWHRVWSHLRRVPYHHVDNLEQVHEAHADFIAQGYEGSILRNPYGPYKSGRCTARESNLLRIKDFEDREARVDSLVEGESNNNPLTINELGQAERSTHKENMIPNGMVGAMLCTDLLTGKPVRVGAGRLTHAERLHYWAHPEQIVGRVVKYKTMPHGMKDKFRFSPFQSFRAESDMS